MSDDRGFDPYAVRIALRKAGVSPIDDPRPWTASAMASWPDEAKQAVRGVLADPAKLLASQLFALDERLLSEDLEDLAALADAPVDAEPDTQRWSSDRPGVLAGIGAVLLQAAWEHAGLDGVPLPDAEAGPGPSVADWIPFLLRPTASSAQDVLPLFLSETSRG